MFKWSYNIASVLYSSFWNSLTILKLLSVFIQRLQSNRRSRIMFLQNLIDWFICPNVSILKRFLFNSYNAINVILMDSQSRETQMPHLYKSQQIEKIMLPHAMPYLLDTSRTTISWESYESTWLCWQIVPYFSEYHSY